MTSAEQQSHAVYTGPRHTGPLYTRLRHTRPCRTRPWRERLTTKLSQGVVGLACLAAMGGCDRASDLDTPEGKAWCGQITLGGPYRDGLSPRVQMRLQVTASLLNTDAAAGTITTFDSGDEELPRLLNEAALRPMSAVTHDPLSELEFGQGRDLNYLFAVSPDDASQQALLAIVSLRNDDQVEVRLLRPGMSDAVSDANRKGIFGVFLLQRTKGDCGF